jgi:hypothetical protein
MMKLKNCILLGLLIAPQTTHNNDDNCKEAIASTAAVCFALGATVASTVLLAWQRYHQNRALESLQEAFTRHINNPLPEGPPPAYSPAGPLAGQNNGRLNDYVMIDLRAVPANPATVTAANRLLTEQRAAQHGLRRSTSQDPIPADE